MKAMDFQPERWHACHESNWPSCEEGVNCYSYVLDTPEYYWSVPGEGFIKTQTKKYFASFDALYGRVAPSDFRAQLIRGAVEDGLIVCDAMIDEAGYYLAALFFSDKENDFHWYRKDDDGLWSHKNGRQAASNIDEAGSLIKNPLECKNEKYPIFGGCFLVPREGIVLKKQFPLGR